VLRGKHYCVPSVQNQPPQATLELSPGEYVDEVSGRKGSWLDQLKIRTNLGRKIQCGGNGGYPCFFMKEEGTPLEVRMIELEIVHGTHLKIVEPLSFQVNNGTVIHNVKHSTTNNVFYFV